LADDAPASNSIGHASHLDVGRTAHSPSGSSLSARSMIGITRSG
jgi:hypothetical protein